MENWSDKLSLALKVLGEQERLTRFYRLLEPAAEELKAAAPELIPLGKDLLRVLWPGALRALEVHAKPREDVRELQQALVQLGEDVGPDGADGVLGEDTLAAVRRSVLGQLAHKRRT